MCVILFVPNGIMIPSNNELVKCWNRNPHGAGVMWQIDGVVQGKKGYMKLPSLLKFIAELREMDDIGDIAIHFRIASHGAINSKNCHPWKIRDNVLMMHNGIIQWCGQDHTVSDSKILAGKLAGYNFTKEGIEILGHAIDSRNKLVVMTPEETHIVNEGSGEWVDDIWYSNTHHMDKFNEWNFPTMLNWSPRL